MLSQPYLILAALFLTGCASLSAEPTAVPLNQTQLSRVATGVHRLTGENTQTTFAVRVAGIGKVDGTFDDINAQLTINDADTGKASLAATVQVASIMMDNQTFLDIVKSPAWFDIDTYPEARFRGQLSRWEADGTGLVSGMMTIKGVERPETFEIRLTCDGLAACPDNNLGFEGLLVIDRTNYDMNALTGLVGRTIALTVRGVIAQDAMEPAAY